MARQLFNFFIELRKVSLRVYGCFGTFCPCLVSFLIDYMHLYYLQCSKLALIVKSGYNRILCFLLLHLYSVT